MYFTLQTPKPGFGPVQSTFRNQRASLCLCLLVPGKSFVRCLFETTLPSPPTRGSIKSTKLKKPKIPETKKVTKLLMRRLSMTIPLTKAMMMMMTKEGMNCLNSKIHRSCDFRAKNRCYSCSLYSNCVWRDRSRQCSVQYFRAESHLSCFIPGPQRWGAIGCSSPQNFFCPEKFVLNK